MLTLFTTAKAFRGHSAIIQRNALQSWKLLHPDVDIILFGDDEGAAAVCAELGVRHDTDIIVNPSGTKRLDSIFNRAQQLARHNLVCYVNCDIVLTQQFTAALKIVSSAKPGFLMVGRRWDTCLAWLIAAAFNVRITILIILRFRGAYIRNFRRWSSAVSGGTIGSSGGLRA